MSINIDPEKFAELVVSSNQLNQMSLKISLKKV